MKLCLVVNNFPSVSETFIFNKVISLAARGHKVHVVCYKKNPSVDLFEKYTLASSNIFIHEIALNKSASSFLNSLALAPSVFFRSFTFNMKRFRKKYEHNYYIQFINNIDYDILHFEFSGIGVSLLPGMNKFKGKKVVSCRGSAEKFKLLVDEHRKTAQAKLFSKVHLIHCVSEDMKRTISPYCNDTSKIFINTPAIDTDFFKPSGKNSQNVCFQVMSVGRLTFLKGYLVGLLAIKALVEKGIKIILNSSP